MNTSNGYYASKRASHADTAWSHHAISLFCRGDTQAHRTSSVCRNLVTDLQFFSPLASFASSWLSLTAKKRAMAVVRADHGVTYF